MIFVERSRPAGPARSTKIMETESLSRAQESMFASEASNPRSGRDIDAEHGSGTADLENIDGGCVNPVAPQGGKDASAPKFHDSLCRTAVNGGRQ
jgi:hypothetical protein